MGERKFCTTSPRVAPSLAKKNMTAFFFFFSTDMPRDGIACGEEHPASVQHSISGVEDILFHVSRSQTFIIEAHEKKGGACRSGFLLGWLSPADVGPTRPTLSWSKCSPLAWFPPFDEDSVALIASTKYPRVAFFFFRFFLFLFINPNLFYLLPKCPQIHF